MDKNGAIGSAVLPQRLSFFSRIGVTAMLHVKKSSMAARPIVSPAIPRPKPSTNPAAAVSLMSPPPILPSLNIVGMNSGNAASIPNSLTGLNPISPVNATSAHILFGMTLLRMSTNDATESRTIKKAACKKSGNGTGYAG